MLVQIFMSAGWKQLQLVQNDGSISSLVNVTNLGQASGEDREDMKHDLEL